MTGDATAARYKASALAALRAGEWLALRYNLLRAAERYYALAAAAEPRSGRRNALVACAKRLAELAAAADGRMSRGAGAAVGERAFAPAPTVGAPRSPGVAADDPDDERARFARAERPSTRFADIAGLEDVKEDIRLKLIYPLAHAEKARRYGIRTGGGVLLYGPPGTGKTMIARAIAGEIDAAFFSVKPSEMLSKWAGEAEKNVAELFRVARAAPLSVVFIDEIDALLPGREKDRSSIMQRLVPQFLAELDGFDTSGRNPLLFLGATNKPWALDSAVLRPGRFDAKIYVGLPDRAARRAMLAAGLRGRPVAGLDLGALAAHWPALFARSASMASAISYDSRAT